MLARRIHMFFVTALMMLLLVSTHAFSADFCWKGSYGRGVGTIPDACTGGKNLEIGMCYTPCKQGWDGAVTMCLRKCPSGYVNTGLSCHVDKALLVPANVDVCNMKTTCPSGYTNAGLLCGLNTPSVPGGYEALVSGPAASGLDLTRQPYDRGIGNAPTACLNGKENDTGLCYPKCNTNFSGIGPVCWGQCPAGWTNCGMGCAKSANECAKTAVGQVTAVGLSATSIGLMIASAGASGAASTAVNQTKIPGLLGKLNEMKAFYKANETAFQAAGLAAGVGVKTRDLIVGLDNPNVTELDIARLSAQIAGLLDPSGLISAGSSFAYDTCDKIK
jgi:hypothetical protein